MSSAHAAPPADAADWGHTLTTQEAAHQLGVSPATVKRWAHARLLAYERTMGGHRRFRATDVATLRLKLLGEKAAFSEWVGALLADPDRALLAAFGAERERLGTWAHVADALAPVIQHLGDFPRESALDTRQAAARLTRVLSRCCEPLRLRANAPRAVLAVAQREEHTLGLSLVELCMRELGWKAMWWDGTPVAELVAAIRRGETDVVALSASAARHPAALASELGELAPACRERGVALVIGGRGPWPEELEYGHRERTFRGLREWMVAYERAGGRTY